MNSLFRRKSVDDIMRQAAAGELADAEAGHPMKRVLGVRDLTFFGIAAVIGTGVFTAIGSACYSGGPAVILLFMITAMACGFAAYCYAEFASMVPVSGSAYTYSYVAFGEIFAWIIGWDLLMEYAIGNIAVAISWSQYFVRVLEGFGLHIPAWLTTDYATAHAGFDKATPLLQAQPLSSLDFPLQQAYNAWQAAPTLAGFRIIMNVPALLITVLITAIVYVGIRESKRANNLFVWIKLGVILLVIVAGAFYVAPANWSPFMPGGFKGVLSGVSAVFFAYIGFDAISTTAEECRNPQRDLPRAMFNTLLICTGLYCILVLVLTGMTKYTAFDGVADPLAFVFEMQGTPAGRVIAGIVSVSAVFVIASVLLVYQIGQPRIWMSMSRDGLLPPVFSGLHPRYKTPSFATVMTGIVVGFPALFLNLDVVISLTSIGTLFAFVLVCGGLLVLQGRADKPASRFKVPYINGRLIVPGLLLVALSAIILSDKATHGSTYFSSLVSLAGIPMAIFWLVVVAITVQTYRRSFSLIPVLGLVSCFYLMAQESHTNWLRFLLWLTVGLVLYFLYGRLHSKLRHQQRAGA